MEEVLKSPMLNRLSNKSQILRKKDIYYLRLRKTTNEICIDGNERIMINLKNNKVK